VSAAANAVQQSLRSVEPEIAVLTPQGALGNANQFALLAGQARDSIDRLRQEFATSGQSGSLGIAEGELSAGANDLGKAMAALVAYNGTPSAGTLAHFLSEYQNARSEWNSGIRTVWRIAGAGNPPTV
jgi:hypothetical protein